MSLPRRQCVILRCNYVANGVACLPTKAMRWKSSRWANPRPHQYAIQSLSQLSHSSTSLSVIDAGGTGVGAVELVQSASTSTSGSSFQCSLDTMSRGPFTASDSFPDRAGYSSLTSQVSCMSTASAATTTNAALADQTVTSAAAECEGGTAWTAAGGQAAHRASTIADHDLEAPDWLQRTTLLLGREGVAALQNTRVLVVGLGGVGSYVAEFLVRSGIGSLAVVDGDVVDVSNKNRQLPALDSTIGLPKAQVMSRRLLDINPDLNLVVRQEFLRPDAAAEKLLSEVAAELDRGVKCWTGKGIATSSSSGAKLLSGIRSELEGVRTATAAQGDVSCRADSSSSSNSSNEDCADPSFSSRAENCAAPLHWVVDCIDSVAPKLALVAAAAKRGARVVSSMGAGGRMDPLAVHVADISETYGDPFAATCRRGLRRQYGIRSGVTVVFSTEPCRRNSMALTSKTSRFKRSYYGTTSFLPALFGLQIAAHIVNSITGGPMLASEAEHRRRLRQMRVEQTGGKTAASVRVHGSSGGGGGIEPGHRRRSAGTGTADSLQLPPLPSVPQGLLQQSTPELRPRCGSGEALQLRMFHSQAVALGSGFEGANI